MNPLNFINEQLESALTDTNNWWHTTMQNHYRDFAKKKEAFLKEKFTEKGFGHLFEGLGKKKFPKVMIIRQNDWDYYYADNDTDEGAFIVAVKDHSYRMDGAGFDDVTNSYQMKIEFQWQDKLPLVDYIKGNI